MAYFLFACQISCFGPKDFMPYDPFWGYVLLVCMPYSMLRALCLKGSSVPYSTSLNGLCSRQTFCKYDVWGGHHDFMNLSLRLKS